jgi:hypothetical protein
MCETQFFQANSSRVLFSFKDVGRILVQQGREIIIHPAPNSMERDLRLHLLCSVMGAVLYERDCLLLHGCAIATENGSYVFLGRKGVGKSTIAACFFKRGYKVMSDDICMISFLLPMHNAIVQPAYPQFKLKRDALDLIGINSLNLNATCSQMEKYVLSVRNQFQHTPLPLKGIYLLERKEERSLKTIGKQEGLLNLFRYSYKKKLAFTEEKKIRRFNYCTLLAHELPIKRICRPFDIHRINETMDFIEKDLK